jgi:hypothetical protein
MVEQLQAARMDREWLELAAADLAGCVQRARQDGAFVDAERSRLLTRCSPAVAGHPLLGQWLQALTEPIIDLLDLEAAAEFLGRAGLLWDATEGPPVGSG